MAKKTTTAYLMSVIITLSIGSVASETPVTAYVNHTVGGSAGWFFNSTTNTSSANFSAWAANETFSLGDYLIFNTNTNQTVIETYNQTTYRSCSIDESEDDDTFQYGGGSSNQVGEPTVIAVALTKEEPSYYFSNANDGVQCLNGMAFEISVQHGLGLPSSLSQPPPPPYAEPPAGDDGQSPPVTVENQPGSGGVVAGANLRWGLSVLLSGVTLIVA